MTSSAPVISVQGLYKRYREFEAVRGIDFEVARGEVFGLLGPNGAGKTATVKMLGGLPLPQRRRRLHCLGFDPAQRPQQLRRRVGIVLQSCGIYRHITVREALAHWATFYPAPRAVDEVLTLAGRTDDQHRRTRQLSGGQQRRLDFALALIGDPELIFLDEPTTGFDPVARRKAWETVLSLKALGKTVLLTTHYLEEAQVLADRVAIIKHGRILAAGPPSQLAVDEGPRCYRVPFSRLLRMLVFVAHGCCSRFSSNSSKFAAGVWFFALRLCSSRL